MVGMDMIPGTLDIDALEAGPKLDELVARRVLEHITAAANYISVLPYSTDIAAAWQVVEHLEKQGYYIGLSVGTSIGQSNVLIKHPRDWTVGTDYWPNYGATGETMPLAIARCALKAIAASDGVSGG